jgi:hypothetical protein
VTSREISPRALIGRSWLCIHRAFRKGDDLTKCQRLRQSIDWHTVEVLSDRLCGQKNLVPPHAERSHPRWHFYFFNRVVRPVNPYRIGMQSLAETLLDVLLR